MVNFLLFFQYFGKVFCYCCWEFFFFFFFVTSHFCYATVLSVTFQSISQLLLHNNFLPCFEGLPRQTIDSVVHQLAGSLIKIMVSQWGLSYLLRQSFAQRAMKDVKQDKWDICSLRKFHDNLKHNFGESTPQRVWTNAGSCILPQQHWSNTLMLSSSKPHTRKRKMPNHTN